MLEVSVSRCFYLVYRSELVVFVNGKTIVSYTKKTQVLQVITVPTNTGKESVQKLGPRIGSKPFSLVPF